MTQSEQMVATDALRAAAESIARKPRAEMRTVAKVIGEVLLDHAETRSTTVSSRAIDARCAEFGASDSTGEVDSVRPIEVLRRGPNSDEERAVVSVLMARFLGEMLDGESGPTRLKAQLNAIDWLEFTGPYAPYEAADIALGSDTGGRFAKLLRDTPVANWSLRAMAAVRALRGLGADGEAALEGGRSAGLSRRPRRVSVAAELMGASRGFWTRMLSVFSGLAVVRALVVTLGRGVFSFKRPTTISVEGDTMRMVGHSEVLGRTLRTWDWKVALGSVRELKKEARFPWAPAALSIFGLTLGTLFGARKVIEGAGAKYFPLVAIGLGLIALGIGFELVLRALWPGLTGKMRLTLRTDDGRAMEFSHLDPDELERLLRAVEGTDGADAKGAPRATGSPASTALTSESSHTMGAVSDSERSHWEVDAAKDPEEKAADVGTDEAPTAETEAKTLVDEAAYAAVVQEGVKGGVQASPDGSETVSAKGKKKK